MSTERKVTELLREHGYRRAAALADVVERVYADLERLARERMPDRLGARREEATLPTTALALETCVLLIEQEKPFVNRQHFFAVVTRVMLRALMKYHGGHNDSRRGGGRPRVSLAAIGVSSYGTPVDALELLRVLESLREHDVQCANVVTCRCLFGKTTAETAADLGMSERHVDLAWEFAKAWLVAHLGRDAIDPS